MIPVPTSPRNELFRLWCQPHLNSINNINNERPTIRKFSSQFEYYKCKLKRINVSTNKCSKFGSSLNDFRFEKILTQRKVRRT